MVQTALNCIECGALQRNGFLNGSTPLAELVVGKQDFAGEVYTLLVSLQELKRQFRISSNKHFELPHKTRACSTSLT
jgi:hypothetical protein